MLINERLSRLYDEWEKEHPGEQLKRHGLVDENTYTSTSTKPRIVLLGKELNCQGNPDFNLLEFLNCELEKGTKGNNFEWPVKQAGLWAYGLRTEFQEDYGKFDKFARNSNAALGLKGIGWANLSKICGEGKASAEWKKRACNQRKLTEKELEIMNPQLILCAGADTYGLVDELLELGLPQLLLPKANHRREINYSIWHLGSHECLCLDFYHHAARGGYKKYYEILNEVFDKCKKNGLCTWL
jgi:hypothetical protein